MDGLADDGGCESLEGVTDGRGRQKMRRRGRITTTTKATGTAYAYHSIRKCQTEQWTKKVERYYQISRILCATDHVSFAVAVLKWRV